MDLPIRISEKCLVIIKNVLHRHYKTKFYTRKIPEFIYFIYILHCININIKSNIIGKFLRLYKIMNLVGVDFCWL